jgi:hypothetical protein
MRDRLDTNAGTVIQYPKLPEVPREGIFDFNYDSRIFAPLEQHMSPAMAKVVLDATTRELGYIRFDHTEEAWNNVYPHRRKDCWKLCHLIGEVRAFNKSEEAAKDCQSALQKISDTYMIPEYYRMCKHRFAGCNLCPYFKRIKELFVEHASKIDTFRYICEAIDEKLEQGTFDKDKDRFTTPIEVRYDIFYLDNAFKAVAQWVGAKGAEHLRA